MGLGFRRSGVCPRGMTLSPGKSPAKKSGRMETGEASEEILFI